MKSLYVTPFYMSSIFKVENHVDLNQCNYISHKRLHIVKNINQTLLIGYIA